MYAVIVACQLGFARHKLQLTLYDMLTYPPVLWSMHKPWTVACFSLYIPIRTQQ